MSNFFLDNKIHRLSDQTINQIAAGEVIENPSSVVKELVENAIDAGAAHLCIDILAGGFQWIKVSDDGSGMTPEDAVLCLERHATSKILDADDLFSLSTLGFRGEALASIAAISKMTVLTSFENRPAVLLEVEGGKIVHVGAGARSRGTTIEVRSLFYNVPARKKFQKSVTASSAAITKTITQLALAHPEVGFELTQQNRLLFSLPRTSGEDFLFLLKRRMEVLLGEEFLSSCHPLEIEEGQYQAKGFIADPLFSRHHRSGQYLFVNHRPVFCPAISYAVRDSYGTRLGADRHPVYLLHLSISSQFLDVNVHPQKKEIRLREENQVKQMIHEAINRAFGGNASLSNPLPFPTLKSKEIPFLFNADMRPDFSEPLIFREEPEEVCDGMKLDNEVHAIGIYNHYLLVEAKSCPPFLSLGAQGIVWVDLLAAEARLYFETLLRNIEKGPLSQGLLIPLTLSYSQVEAQLFRSHLNHIQQLGIQMREIGQTVFLVEAIPPFLEEEEVRIVLEEVIVELQGIEHEKMFDEEKNRRLAACICRRARSRRKAYSLTEAIHVIKQLFQANDPFYCPQGKKILFHFKEEDIERCFTGKETACRTFKAFAK